MIIDCFGQKIENEPYYKIVPIFAERAVTSYIYRDFELAMAICKSCNKTGERWVIKKIEA